MTTPLMIDTTGIIPSRDYLGDGVYAEFDGCYVWLSTLEGDRIGLESDVLVAFDRYRARLLARIQEATARAEAARG